MGKGHARRLSRAGRSLHGVGRPGGVSVEGMGSAVRQQVREHGPPSLPTGGALGKQNRQVRPDHQGHTRECEMAAFLRHAWFCSFRPTVQNLEEQGPACCAQSPETPP